MAGTRHCMVVHSHYPVGETRVQRQALALVDRGVEVEVFCLRGPGEPRRETVDGVVVRRLPVGRHRDRGMAWQMVEYLIFFILAMVAVTRRHLDRRYRTVQVHNLPDFLVFCAVVPKLTGARVILDIHDLMPEFFAAKTGRGLRHPLVRLVALQERLSCRFADHVITVTSEWKQTLADRAVAEDRITVVMNLADPRMFAPATRSRADRDRGRLDVVYHGTFTHRYGVDLLIRAVHRAAREVPGIRLHLIGDGDARDELRDLARSLDLNGRVKFSEGMVDAAGLRSILADADVGVVPNRSDIFTDGLLPTKLLEYTAVGVPVVAARTRGVSAYFDDSMVAFFEPGSEESLAARLQELDRDRDRLDELAANASEFNTRYSWEGTAGAYADLVAGIGG